MLTGQYPRDHGNHAELYVHLMWATQSREPLIKGALQRAIYACIQAECTRLRAEVLAVGGVEDHVHLLLRIPTTLAVANVAKQVKGASSHLATHACHQEGFGWQEGYASFTVSRWDVSQIANYIKRQAEHHGNNTVRPDLEVPEPTG